MRLVISQLIGKRKKKAGIHFSLDDSQLHSGTPTERDRAVKQIRLVARLASGFLFGASDRLGFAVGEWLACQPNNRAISRCSDAEESMTGRISPDIKNRQNRCEER